MDKEKKLLVKTSSKIIGPISESEVYNKVLAGEITGMDEVSLPLGRFKYIKDETAFQGALNKQREPTEDQPDITIASHTNTTTQTDDSTPTSRLSIPPKPPAADINFKEIVDAKEVTLRQGANNTKSYGLNQDERVQKRNLSTTLGTWLWATIAIIIALVVVYFYKMPHLDINKNSWEFNLQKGVEAYGRGHYHKALEYLKRADQLKPANADIQIKLAPLLIILNGETTTGIRMLENLQNQYLHQIDVKIALATAHIIDEQYALAEKELLDVLILDSQNFTALLNLGTLNFLKSDYNGANLQYLKADETKSGQTLATPMRALSLIKLFQTSRNHEPLLEAEKLLENYIKFSFDYRQESLLLLTYTKLHLNRTIQDIEGLIIDLLTADPYLTEEHSHELLALRKSLNWENLNHYCDDVSSSQNTPTYKILNAYCDIKSNKFLVIQNFVKESAPGDTLIQAINAFYLMQTGRETEGEAALQIALRDPNLFLAKILMARRCTNKEDYTCAKKFWLSILERDSRALNALGYLGRIEYAAGNTDLSRKYLDQGLRLSPHYIPLVDLKHLLNGEN